MTKFWGSKIRYRPLEEVINEIKLSGADMVFFTDDNFITNPRRVRQLCELLIPLKINYFCQIDALAYKHHDLIELLSRSGCIMTFIGFESISTSTLSAFNKTFNDPNNYSQLIHLLDKNGIITFASAIFGMENDTPEVVKNTVAFFEVK